jgi:Bax protein
MKKIDLKKYPMPFKVSIVLLPVLLMVAISWFYSEKEEIIPEEILPEITVQDKKERFVSIIVPVVNEVYADLMEHYHEVAKSIQAGTDKTELEALRRKYKATNNEELLMALKPHPKSIALAQAAMESAWATSRFFTEANNVFGVWSFNKSEPRIAAGKKRGNKTIWLKKYPSVKASMQDYYRTLARGAAFSEFRKLKMETSDPYALVKKLDRYSEKGKEYGKELSAIIQFNNFNTYDTQEITKL